MTTLEIIMLIVAAICIIVSFIMPASAAVAQPDTSSFQPELSEYQKEIIRNKVDEAVSQELDNVIEKTEISLDKISNTKILEMQEYADTIFVEMNRNHNETMFLYDMLNDKAKEVKAIVRDIHAIRPEEDGTLKNIKESKNSTTSREALRDNDSLVSKEQSESDIFEKLLIQAANEEDYSEVRELEKSTGNEVILELYKQGKSVLEIAKELNLGIGQTKLVIDLFKGKK